MFQNVRLVKSWPDNTSLNVLNDSINCECRRYYTNTEDEMSDQRQRNNRGFCINPSDGPVE